MHSLHPRMKARCSASCGLRSESHAKIGGAVASDRNVAKTIGGSIVAGRKMIWLRT